MCTPSRSSPLFAALIAAVLVACSSAPDAAAPPDPSHVDDTTEAAPDGDEAASDGDPAPADADIHASLDHLERAVVRLEHADGGGAVDVVVTVPTTDEQFRQGLMEVPWLEDGTGMLFDFGRERDGGFWMKDTLVALDIAFAAEDGRVLRVLAMDPCEAVPCPTYDPEVAYRYALEVPQGWFAANDLGPGDRLVHDPDA